jgi:agmatine deiminase
MVFGFNGWGRKATSWELDEGVPSEIISLLDLNSAIHNFILEPGSIELNGKDALMTTKECILNKNRNEDYDQEELESMLKEAFSISDIIWLERGLEGDYKDGHISNFARFISENKILLCQTTNAVNPNYETS